MVLLERKYVGGAKVSRRLDAHFKKRSGKPLSDGLRAKADYALKKRKSWHKEREIRGINTSKLAKSFHKTYPWHAKDSEDTKLSHHNQLAASIPNLRKPNIHLKKNNKGVYESKLILEYLKPTLSKGAKHYRNTVRSGQNVLLHHIDKDDGISQDFHHMAKKVVGQQREASRLVKQNPETRDKRFLGKKKMYDPVKGLMKRLRKYRPIVGQG